MHFEKSISHNWHHAHFDKNINITMELMEALWAKYIPKGMPTKTIIPKYHVMILFMKAHICMLIVMQI